MSNDAGNIDLVAGSNVTITPNDVNNTITIAAAGGGGIGGSGTPGYVPKFTAATTLGNSLISDDGTHVMIGQGTMDVGIEGTSVESHVAGAATFCADYLGATVTDVAAVKGRSVPADYYGVGGVFEGGYIGVAGRVYPTTGDQAYYGVHGQVASLGGWGSKYGVHAEAQGPGTNYGILAIAEGGSNNYGIVAAATTAGQFVGDVEVWGSSAVWGDLYVSGTKSFRIDHPTDPANKYLNHFCTESSEALNTYSGNVVLDGSGEAWVQLADWFELINRDPRYQLTCVGGSAPVYVAEEISGNRFRIAGGLSGLKVSWQVTAVRNDPAMQTRQMLVEQDKTGPDRGKYIDPSLYGQPETMRIGYLPPKAPGK